jgi:hypothetical protein
MISTLIMGSPDPSSHQPDYTLLGPAPITAMQGQTTDEAPDQMLDAKRLTLMSGRPQCRTLSAAEECSEPVDRLGRAYFDPERQIGAGEYTYRGRRQYHGVALVQLRDERISRWREYQYQHDADWEEFVGDSRFAS